MSDAKPKSVPITRLVQLGAQAPTFDLPVNIAKLDGTTEVVTIPCKAMRKTEWAALRDARQRAILEATLKPAADEEDQGEVKPANRIGDLLDDLTKRGHEANVREGLQRDADLVLSFISPEAIAEGVDAEFLAGIEDKYGGSLAAILMAYDVAIYHGRLGN